MNKTSFAAILLGINLMTPALCIASDVSFDPNTQEGRQKAYQALRSSSVVGNANRLIRSLKGVDTPQAKALIPQLTNLVESYGGTVQTNYTPKLERNQQQ